eukprot:14744823-Alexandrium_andersonii.AAC.1
MCATVKGKLGWLSAICAPHLAVVSRIDDTVLQTMKPKDLQKLLKAGPSLVIHPLNLMEDIHIN